MAAQLFELKSKDPRFPALALAWDDAKDEYLFTLDAVQLPPLTGLQVAALYLALHSLRNQNAHDGSPAGTRAEEPNPSVPAQ